MPDSEPANNQMPAIRAVIVAAGTGERAGRGLPKQFRPLGGEPVLRRTVRTFVEHPSVASVVAVIAADHDGLARAALDGLTAVEFATGANTRQASVKAGLEHLAHIADQSDIVLVHDAARPFVSSDLIDRVAAAAAEHGAAIPGLPITDTLKSVDAFDTVLTTVSREPLRRVQTPQGFRFGALLDAHCAVARDDQGATDDAALIGASGGTAHIVDGDPDNLKLTTEADFSAAERLLDRRMETRTGFGYDVHRLGPGDGVRLCGVFIPHDAALIGHSDADVGLHAVTDAILGAISAGDIGQHFPPSDPQWRGAESDFFLNHAGELVRTRGGSVLHVDVTLICEAPKIGPHRDAMRRRISEILGLSLSRVSIKATTTERLGPTGRGEGIACHALATVSLPRETGI